MNHEARIAPAALGDFAAGLFSAAGSDAAEARIVADHLVESNLVGQDSHGVIRVPKYLDWVAEGGLLVNRHASVVVDAGALVVVDGVYGYGQVIGREAMALAEQRVRRHGIAVIGIRNSGHLGRIGAWPEQLAAAGIVSVHFVSTSGFGLLVAPFGGTDRRLSANPIAAGAPGPDGPIVLDIATSATAEGKIQVARNKHESLPQGQVLDGAGHPTDDPEKFYADPPGAILPFGGHKGSGLSLFCEILAGSLTGGASTHPTNPTAWRLVNNMLTIAFAPGASDPHAFAPDTFDPATRDAGTFDPAVLSNNSAFDADLTRLTTWVRSARRARPNEPVLLPGEIERRTRAQRMEGGIPLDAETCRQLVDAARGRSVAIPNEITEAANA